ncbi:helix-turn-helix domain-containing protein [Legionella sp. MW5194]|uniref:helix-turn-helix domain-containing protein n=1 Tax=Legionella sp. MW5194 TaxID=2662448 RepID=UPI00193D4B56|nr:helix-turn-helix domain-containing protein [Legionella sp. MW5194]QRN02973.1 helix-turn-helix domain-containing protein [Legionella sp. MW5194]
MKTLDLEKAAEFLGAHKETIRRLVATGRLPGVKIGSVIQHAKGTVDQQLMGPPKMSKRYLSNLSTFS